MELNPSYGIQLIESREIESNHVKPEKHEKRGFSGLTTERSVPERYNVAA